MPLEPKSHYAHIMAIYFLIENCSIPGGIWHSRQCVHRSVCECECACVCECLCEVCVSECVCECVCDLVSNRKPYHVMHSSSGLHDQSHAHTVSSFWYICSNVSTPNPLSVMSLTICDFKQDLVHFLIGLLLQVVIFKILKRVLHQLLNQASLIRGARGREGELI